MMEKTQTAIEELGNESIEASAESTRINHGGTAAWLCAFGGFMISFTCYGVANTFGVFEDYYSANQLSNESLNNISWIGSLQLCLILLVGCVSGPLCDAGYFKHLIGFGGLLFFFCLMMTSISKVYYQYILSQGVGVGLAQGFLFTPGMAVLTHHFKRHRTLIFGIFAAGASIGGVILPIALQRLFEEVGFAWGVRILAFIVLACVGTGFICCTTRFPPRKGGRVLDIRVFRSPSYTLLVLGAGFVGLGLYAPVNFGVVYATDHQMSQQSAFYSLAILNAGSLVGRTLPNILATIFGPLNLLIVACTASSVLLYIWFLATGNGAMLVFEAIYGVTSGAYVSCLPAATASLSKNPNETGLRLGMMFFSTSFFWLWLHSYSRSALHAFFAVFGAEGESYMESLTIHRRGNRNFRILVFMSNGRRNVLERKLFATSSSSTTL
ncbi:major facilitator superfamily domain-containing protein [Lentinula edodes]|uniref:major facilitator superfamily domain-containing protein n=1 Tax=Lentinula edodes TaxID=5353 RepID=UPI001E8ECFDA|nr:major facilitator superfamily domain-containing protein [Lentinula edodes]KAH7868024.1 major facilitator superfamily domain-containing protein [Lentinula edodes]